MECDYQIIYELNTVKFGELKSNIVHCGDNIIARFLFGEIIIPEDIAFRYSCSGKTLFERKERPLKSNNWYLIISKRVDIDRRNANQEYEIKLGIATVLASIVSVAGYQIIDRKIYEGWSIMRDGSTIMDIPCISVKELSATKEMIDETNNVCVNIRKNIDKYRIGKMSYWFIKSLESEPSIESFFSCFGLR